MIPPKRILAYPIVMIVALALVVGAAAQTPGYAVAIDTTSTSEDTDENRCATFEAEIRNSGSIPGNQQVALSTDPGDTGWVVEPAPPTSVSLGPGDSEAVTFGLCAPQDADDGASGTVTLHAEMTSDPGPTKPTDSASFTATYRAPDDPFTPDDGGDDPNGNLTGENGEDVGMGAGNETDGNGTPGPAALLVVAATMGLVYLARRD